MNAPGSPYREPSAPPAQPRSRDRGRMGVVLLAFALAALPFIQLAVTGDASQADLGVSVLLLFPIASWWLEERTRHGTGTRS